MLLETQVRSTVESKKLIAVNLPVLVFDTILSYTETTLNFKTKTANLVAFD